MPRELKINATEHNVESVTIYQYRAEVTRKFEVTLESGQTEVEISKLPSCLDESSLRVDGRGNAVIFDVVYERLPTNVSNPQTPTGSRKSERLLEMEKEEASLCREQKALSNQSRVLDDFSRTLSAKDYNTAQLEGFLDMLGTRGSDYMTRQDELENRLSSLRSEIATEQRKARGHEKAHDLAANVTVVVLAKEAGLAELSVTYVVSNATWTPLYDFRAEAEPTGKAATTVSLTYRASITQTTGEDWNNVTLVLSTSSPLVGAQIPTLRPQTVSPQVVHKPQLRTARRALTAATPFAMARAAPRGASRARQEEAEESDDDMGYGLFESAPAMSAPTAVATEGVVSASFHIEGDSSIPSDSSTHKVAIAVIGLVAELEWIAVPKQNSSAFLQCQVTNSSPYVLLEGNANVFLDGSFVSRSIIPHVSPQEQFPCSLGVDPSIRITYHPQSKKDRTASSLFSVKTQSTVFSQRITVKNTRQTQVKLNVRDQVPVSQDARFKINVLEPKDLALAPALKEVPVSAGVLAFWARKGWDNNVADVTSKVTRRPETEGVDGQMEWYCQLGPGATTELLLSWEISAPVGEKWMTR